MGREKVNGQLSVITSVGRKRMGKAFAVQSGRALPLGRCKASKGAFPYTRQRRAAAAAATYITIYGSNPEIIIPYIVM